MKPIETTLFVIYTRRGSDTIKYFETGTDLDEFVLEFLLENQGDEDNQINLIYKYGKVEHTDYKEEARPFSNSQYCSDDIPF